MQSEERPNRPPLTIQELEDQKRPSEEGQAKQGPLGFAGEAKSNGTSGSNGGDDGGGKKGRFSLGGGKGAQMVVPALVAVILAAGMLFMFAPSKADVNVMKNTVNNLSEQVAELTTLVTAAHERIDDFVNDGGSAPDLSAYATKDELNGYVKNGELDVLNNRVGYLESYHSGGNGTPVIPTPTPTPGLTPTPSPTPSVGELTTTVECVGVCPASSPDSYSYRVEVFNSGDAPVAGSLVVSFDAFSYYSTVNTTATQLVGSGITFTGEAVPSSGVNCIALEYTSTERTFFRGSNTWDVTLNLAYVSGQTTWTASAEVE